MLSVPKEPVSQVVFVEDYFQLVFQDECFSFYDLVEVASSQRVVSRWQPGFCDALVELIGTHATSVAVGDTDELTVVFADGSALRTCPGSGTGPEAWQFNGPGGQVIGGRPN